MILRKEFFSRSILSVLLLLGHVVRGDDEFNCIFITSDTKYDLTALSGPHTATRIRNTPPTSMNDTVRFDLCKELETLSDVDSRDQCAAGTRVCLTTVNTRDNDNRVIVVVPVAQNTHLKPEYLAIPSPKGVSLILHGPNYPPDKDGSPLQSLNLTVQCSSTTEEHPTIDSYDGTQLRMTWRASQGCGTSTETPSEDNKEGSGDQGGGGENNERVGSGLGFFFLVLLLAFIGYLAFGAYYNYSTYGASGMDLIPHRDFWKEVPYMLSDVVSHLCSSVHPRRSGRSGYIAV